MFITTEASEVQIRYFPGQNGGQKGWEPDCILQYALGQSHTAHIGRQSHVPGVNVTHAIYRFNLSSLNTRGGKLSKQVQKYTSI